MVPDIQPEDGTVRIANATFDAIAAADLTRVELLCLMAVLRQSWGFGRKSTGDWCSLSFVQKYTGLKRSDCSRGLKGLVQKQLIGKIDGSATQAAEYLPVKNYERWSPGVVPAGFEPIGGARVGTSDGSGTSDRSGTSARTGASGGDRSGTTQETSKSQEKKINNNGARLGARVEAPAMGPTDAEALLSRFDFTHRGTGRKRPPNHMEQVRAVTIVSVATAEQVDAAYKRCLKNGWGWGGFSREFDDDGRYAPTPEKGGARGSRAPQAPPTIDNAPTVRQWLDNDSRREEWLYSVARLHGDSTDDEIWNYTTKRGAEFSPPDALRDEAIAYVRAVAERLL